MSIEALVARYGLPAIFLGAGLEGEAAVVTGGVLAHDGLVPLWGAMLAAFAGSCLADQLWFVAGRSFRDHRWVKRVRETSAFSRALDILERHPTGFVLGFRFVYGMRTVSPIAIGTSRVPAAKFVPLNILAAAVWAPLFTALGDLLGKAAGPLLDRIARDGLIAVGAAAVVIVPVVLWLIRRRRDQAREKVNTP